MEKTWDALVNPECDIANSFLHKITDADVAQAPTFADIANTVASLLAGRMMVAHNASFEQRFLRQEFARLGVVWPAYGDWIIDTQELSTQFLGKAKLQEALDAAGIINFRPHSALSDAMSAGKWLQWLAQQDSDITFNTGQLFIYPSGLPNPLASLSRSSGIDADEQRWLCAWLRPCRGYLCFRLRHRFYHLFHYSFFRRWLRCQLAAGIGRLCSKRFGREIQAAQPWYGLD